jgi:serine protease Do
MPHSRYFRATVVQNNFLTQAKHMRKKLCRAITAACITLLLGGAGTEGRAQYSRRTPIVEAVQKTRRGIVAIKVTRDEGKARKELVGTGVIVDERGYVLTNGHVVFGAERVLVRLHDGTNVDARIHTEDHRHDLAILKLAASGKKLQALTFAPGGDLMVGETVIAVGHPFGFTNTVSTGIISALDREITMPDGETLTNLIQTDASINSGSSGGPLLNINGELIGINVALREGAHGIAFALNADTVQQVLAGRLSAGKIAHLHHGLICREVLRDDAPARQQVVIERVPADGPAAAAGLRRGDMLVKIGARSVTNRFDLERALWDCKPGERIEAAIVRDGRPARVSLKLIAIEEHVKPVGVR